MKRLILYILVCAGTISMSTGQSFKAFMEEALNSSEELDFYSALTYYEYALKYDEEALDVRKMAADAARQFNSYRKALDHYKIISTGDDNAEYPDAQFYLGEMYQRMGKYDSAMVAYQDYIALHGGSDEFLLAKAEKEIEACKWAMNDAPDRSEEYEIDHLGEEINTPYSEFGAIERGEDLYFSSLRFEKEDDGVKRKSIEPEKNISKILKAEENSQGQELGEDVNRESLLTAHTAFNEEGDLVYFTVCEYLNANEIRCDLYQRKVNEDGSFGEEVKLPEFINIAATTSTQPAVGELDGNAVLFFVSDREGGKGGLDLWYSAIEEQGFGQPQNLAELNTAEDELSPYFDFNSNRFFFSSSGYIGFGGFDVFEATEIDGVLQKPKNLGKPVNSSYNDVYYTYNGEEKTGHFSSNRIGSMYLEESFEACCYDIYAYTFIPNTAPLIVHTLDRISLDSIYGATVYLINSVTGDTLAVQTDPESATYVFEVERGENYLVVVEKEGYTGDQTIFNTDDLVADEPIVKKLFLQSDEIELDVFTFNTETGAELNKVTVDLISTNKDGVSDTIRNFNLLSHEHNFKIKRGYDYLLIGNRPGFSTATETISAEELATVEKRITRDLFLGLQDLNALLPIVVYFDNDHPDPDVWNYTTNKIYSETYPPYMAKKQEFVNVFTEPLSGVEKDQASTKIENFFDREVQLGNVDLELFLKLLKVELDRSEEVEVFLSGFTSPRYTSAYNYRLGTRRIRSVRNELRSYDEGIYSPYFSNGSLDVRLKSFGEAESPEDVISDMDDERNSIYSVEASRERRTEISEVKIQKK